MDKMSLNAKKRTLIGRKVKNLRKQGIIPANIYGKKVKSTAVEVGEKDFSVIYGKSGLSGLLNLSVDGKDHPVLIHKVQTDVLSKRPLHIDFFQVDLKEKVTAKVPLVAIGEAPAVKDKIGVVLHLLSEVEIEALPSDLLDKIEIDISNLKAVDQSIKISDLKVSDKIKIMSDSNLDIIKIAPLVSKEAEALAKEEAEKAAAAAAAAAQTTAQPGTQPAGAPQTETAKETTPQPSPSTENKNQ